LNLAAPQVLRGLREVDAIQRSRGHLVEVEHDHVVVAGDSEPLMKSM